MSNTVSERRGTPADGVIKLRSGRRNDLDNRGHLRRRHPGHGRHGIQTHWTARIALGWTTLAEAAEQYLGNTLLFVGQLCERFIRMVGQRPGQAPDLIVIGQGEGDERALTLRLFPIACGVAVLVRRYASRPQRPHWRGSTSALAHAASTAAGQGRFPCHSANG